MVKQEPGCINSPTPDSLQTSVNNIHSNTMERADNNKRRISSNEEITMRTRRAKEDEDEDEGQTNEDEGQTNEDEGQTNEDDVQARVRVRKLFTKEGFLGFLMQSCHFSASSIVCRPASVQLKNRAQCHLQISLSTCFCHECLIPLSLYKVVNSNRMKLPSTLESAFTDTLEPTDVTAHWEDNTMDELLSSILEGANLHNSAEVPAYVHLAHCLPPKVLHLRNCVSCRVRVENHEDQLTVEDWNSIGIFIFDIYLRLDRNLRAKFPQKTPYPTVVDMTTRIAAYSRSNICPDCDVRVGIDAALREIWETSSLQMHHDALEVVAHAHEAPEEENAANAAEENPNAPDDAHAPEVPVEGLGLADDHVANVVLAADNVANEEQTEMVKQEPDDSIHSPTSHSLQTSVNNIHSDTMERVNNNKRRISSNEEEPPSKQSARIVTLFLSSEDDPTAVGIICKHIKEFSNICKSNGFELSIELVDDGDRIDVNLTQLVAVCGIRKVFKEMETLLHSKSDREKTLEKELTTISEQLELYKEKVDKLMAEKSETTGNNATVNTTNAPNKNPPIHGLSVNTSIGTTSAKIDTKSSFLLEELEIFKISEELSKKVCDKIAGPCKRKNPFYPLRNKTKNSLLVSYLDYLQADMTRDRTERHPKFCDRFNEGWKDFIFNPGDCLLKIQASTLKNRFHSKENVVGTLQWLSFKNQLGEKFYFYFAVVDYKIVTWSSHQSKEGALKEINRDLCTIFKWNTNFKFALEVPVPSGLGDTFVHSQNRELFEDGEKVITWMKNNFKCLTAGVYGDHDAAIPALYNLFYMTVENQK